MIIIGDKMERSSQLVIRPAVVADTPIILNFIKLLAEYEKLSHEVIVTEDLLRETLFSASPGAEVILGFVDTQPVGFALFFHNFSTFLGRPGLYLEDLFVLSDQRGNGYGKTLLTFLAKLAIERKCGRFEWSVLNWNMPAIQFYERLGAKALDGWTTYRLSGVSLNRLAELSIR